MTPRPTPRRFPEEEIALVRERADLRELVEVHVDLRPAGPGTWKGLCPFHDEKTPSFIVTPSRGTYHCFGCGQHGDAIGWLMEVEHLPFPDAVRALAEKTGVTLTETGSDEDTEKVNQTRKALAVIAATDAFYQDALHHPDAFHAATELARRGFTRDDAATAGCGWAPPDGDALTAHLAEHGFTPAEAVAAGVMRESTRGGAPYPFLRDRLTWPVHNPTGAVVGWGARRLSEDQQGKYVNSAASPWFDKSTLLYGWVTARRAAAKTGRIVVVEGYTDVMACRRAGIDEAVAACGTAVGEGHLRLIERALPEHTRVVFCLDPDEAGQNATVRTWKAAKSLLHRVEGVTLPGGDPCEVWQHHGETALRDAIDSSTSLTGIVLARVVDAGDTTTPDGRSRTARAVADLLSEIPDEVMQQGWASEMAARIGVPVTALSAHAPSIPAQHTAADTIPAEAPASVHAHARDVDLQRRIAARLCMSQAGAGKWLPGIDRALFSDAAALDVLDAVLAAAADINPATMSDAQWTGRLLDHASESGRLRISVLVNGGYDGPASDWELLAYGPAQLRLARAEETLAATQRAAHLAQTDEDIDLALMQLAEAQQEATEARRHRESITPPDGT